MARYEIYKGQFVCHTCKMEVGSLRSYPIEKKLSWMCKDGHVSEVDLSVKKKKADYEREERE